MTYEILIECMHQFRTGKITRNEFMCAFEMWSRRTVGGRWLV